MSAFSATPVAAETIECSICYDVFCNNNVSITPCGHKFCFNCIIKAVSYNKECPICRARLVEESDDEDEDETIYDSDDDDDESEEGEVREERERERESDNETEIDDDEPDPLEIAERLEKNGIKMVDLVSILHCTRSRLYHATFEEFEKMSEKYDEICDELYQEKRENFLFGEEDKNALHAPDRAAGGGGAAACCSV